MSLTALSCLWEHAQLPACAASFDHQTSLPPFSTTDKTLQLLLPRQWCLQRHGEVLRTCLHCGLQVWVIGGALWLELLPALATYHLGWTPEMRSAAAIAVTVTPIVVAPVWWIVRRDPYDTAASSDAVHAAVDGASATIAHYNAAAGVGVVLWVLTLVHVAANSSGLASAVATALRDPAASPAVAASVILAADAAGLWLSLVLFAAIEDGWAHAARVLAGSLVVGPGAAASLYLANVRERRIGLAAMQSLRKME